MHKVRCITCDIYTMLKHNDKKDTVIVIIIITKIRLVVNTIICICTHIHTYIRVYGCFRK